GPHAASLAAEPRRRHVGRGPHHRLPPVRRRQGHGLRRRDAVLLPGYGRASARLLPAPPRCSLAPDASPRRTRRLKMASSLASQRDREILRSFARRIDPSDAGAHNNLGVLYYHKGMHEDAVAAFAKALELDPKM